MNIKLSANTRTFSKKPDKNEAAQISSGIEQGYVSSIQGLITDVEQGIT
jgi:hypothetical protein